VQHENHKVVIVKDCEAIPNLRRTLGPQPSESYANDQDNTLDIKLLELLCFVFHAQALQSHDYKNTFDIY